MEAMALSTVFWISQLVFTLCAILLPWVTLWQYRRNHPLNSRVVISAIAMECFALLAVFSLVPAITNAVRYNFPTGLPYLALFFEFTIRFWGFPNAGFLWWQQHTRFSLITSIGLFVLALAAFVMNFFV
jgi:hypothetical protein